MCPCAVLSVKANMCALGLHCSEGYYVLLHAVVWCFWKGPRNSRQPSGLVMWDWGQSQEMETSSGVHSEGYNVSLCHVEWMCALGLHKSVGDSRLVLETPDNAVGF